MARASIHFYSLQLACRSDEELQMKRQFIRGFILVANKKEEMWSKIVSLCQTKAALITFLNLQ